MNAAILDGANGFIGSSLVGELLKNNYRVIALFRTNSINLLKYKNSKDIKILNHENTNIQEIKCFFKNNIDNNLTYFHLAWDGSIGDARSDEVRQFDNVKQSIEALNFAKKVGCSQFIFTSSIAEDEASAACLDSSFPKYSNYLYGAAKSAARMFLLIQGSKLGIDTRIAKLTNVYGEGDKSNRMLNNTLKKCLKGINPDFTSGEQFYDFIYIDDAIRALRLISENGRKNGIYTIGSGKTKRLKDLLQELNKKVFPNLNFNFGTAPFLGVKLGLDKFNVNNLISDTKFIPKISFIEGCKKTIKWLNKEKRIDS